MCISKEIEKNIERNSFNLNNEDEFSDDLITWQQSVRAPFMLKDEQGN